MAAIATPEPPVEHHKIVERDEPLECDKALDRYETHERDESPDRDEPLERDKSLDRDETIDDDALDSERLGSLGSQSPVRGIMIAVPVGAGIWALVISLVRLALS